MTDLILSYHGKNTIEKVILSVQNTLSLVCSYRTVPLVEHSTNHFPLLSSYTGRAHFFHLSWTLCGKFSPLKFAVCVCVCARVWREREKRERLFLIFKANEKKIPRKNCGRSRPSLLSRKRMNNIFVAKGVYCTVLKKKNEDGKKQKLGSERDKRKGRLIINSEIPFSHWMPPLPRLRGLREIIDNRFKTIYCCWIFFSFTGNSFTNVPRNTWTPKWGHFEVLNLLFPSDLGDRGSCCWLTAQT